MHPCELTDRQTKAYITAFLVNADVEPIKSVPVAIFKSTDDDIMTEDALDEVGRKQR